MQDSSPVLSVGASAGLLYSRKTLKQHSHAAGNASRQGAHTPKALPEQSVRFDGCVVGRTIRAAFEGDALSRVEEPDVGVAAVDNRP